MKRLSILRHAKSSWAEPGLSDFERPLNARGKRQLEALSKWMTSESFSVDKVLCSSAHRTQQTHEALNGALGEHVTTLMPELYEGRLDDYLEAIWAQDDADNLMIIGHNPTCDELVRYLTTLSSPAFGKLMASHFSTSTLAILEFDADDWSTLAKASCSLIELLRPQDLEEV